LGVSKSFAKPYARALFELASDKIERGLWLHRLQVLDKVFQDHAIAKAATQQHSGRAIAWLKETLGDAWLTNGRYRIGASSLLNDLLRQIEKERTDRYRTYIRTTSWCHGKQYCTTGFRYRGT